MAETVTLADRSIMNKSEFERLPPETQRQLLSGSDQRPQFRPASTDPVAGAIRSAGEAVESGARAVTPDVIERGLGQVAGRVTAQGRRREQFDERMTEQAAGRQIGQAGQRPPETIVAPGQLDPVAAPAQVQMQQNQARIARNQAAATGLALAAGSRPGQPESNHFVEESRQLLGESEELIGKNHILAQDVAEKRAEFASKSQEIVNLVMGPGGEVEQARNRIADIQERQRRQAQEADKDFFTAKFGESGGVLARLGAAIAVGFGQFGSAMTGGPNSALQIINKAVDDYARQQQSKLNRLDGLEAGERDYLRTINDELRDELTINEQLKSDALGTLLTKMEQNAANLANKQQQLAASATIEGVRLQKNQLDERVASRLAQNRIQQAQLALQRRAAAAKAAGSTGGQQVSPFLHQIPGISVSKDDVKKAKEMNRGRITMLRTFDKILNLREKSGAQILSERVNPDKRMMDRLWDDLVLATAVATGRGANFPPEERAMVEGLLGGHPGRVGFNVEQSIREAREKMAEDTSLQLADLGFIPTFESDVDTSQPVGRQPLPDARR